MKIEVAEIERVLSLKKGPQTIEFTITNKSGFDWPEKLVANLYNENNSLISSYPVGGLLINQTQAYQFDLKAEEGTYPATDHIRLQIKFNDLARKLKYLSNKIINKV